MVWPFVSLTRDQETGALPTMLFQPDLLLQKVNRPTDTSTAWLQQPTKLRSNNWKTFSQQDLSFVFCNYSWKQIKSSQQQLYHQNLFIDRVNVKIWKSLKSLKKFIFPWSRCGAPKMLSKIYWRDSHNRFQSSIVNRKIKNLPKSHVSLLSFLIALKIALNFCRVGIKREIIQMFWLSRAFSDPQNITKLNLI